MSHKFFLNFDEASPPKEAKKISRLLKLLKVKACQNGASLIEFAFVFPVLLLIILSTLELGIMLAIRVNLQSCTMAGAHYGSTGGYTTGFSRTASATSVMNNGISGVLNPANLTISISSFPSFLIASLGGAGSPNTGNPKEVGKYKMSYAYSPASPLVASVFGTTKVLESITYVKNEETFPS